MISMKKLSEVSGANYTTVQASVKLLRKIMEEKEDKGKSL